MHVLNVIHYILYVRKKEKVAERSKAIDCKSIRIISYIGSNPILFKLFLFNLNTLGGRSSAVLKTTSVNILKSSLAYRIYFFKKHSAHY